MTAIAIDWYNSFATTCGYHELEFFLSFSFLWRMPAVLLALCCTNFYIKFSSPKYDVWNFLKWPMCPLLRYIGEMLTWYMTCLIFAQMPSRYLFRADKMKIFEQQDVQLRNLNSHLDCINCSNLISIWNNSCKKKIIDKVSF